MTTSGNKMEIIGHFFQWSDRDTSGYTCEVIRERVDASWPPYIGRTDSESDMRRILRGLFGARGYRISHKTDPNTGGRYVYARKS